MVRKPMYGLQAVIALFVLHLEVLVKCSLVLLNTIGAALNKKSTSYLCGRGCSAGVPCLPDSHTRT